jgi:hypothetical protein
MKVEEKMKEGKGSRMSGMIRTSKGCWLQFQLELIVRWLFYGLSTEGKAIKTSILD